MQKELIKAWVTKFALTKGIEVVDAEVCHDVNSNMIVYNKNQYAHGNDWHRSLEDALARAEIMRSAKIESHKKSILKLESMKF